MIPVLRTQLRVLAVALCFSASSPFPASAQFTLQVERPETFQTDVAAVGVSAVDFDQDGWDDITIALNDIPPRLLRNNRDGTFTDVAADLGITSPDAEIPLWIDVNADGLLDLFLGQGRQGKNALYIRRPDGTLEERTREFGLDPDSPVDSAAMADFDGDGYPDLFLAIRNGHDLLLQNHGGTGFTDVAAQFGVQGADDTIPMQAVWIDYDLDADPDLLATHDLDWESRFYRNDGPGPWPEIGQENGLAYVGPGSSMGVAWGDPNLDGAPDAYISRIEFGGLYMNYGNGTFSDEATALGPDVNGVSWGVVFGDLDNDADEDLVIASTTSWLGNRPISRWENRDGFFYPANDTFEPWTKGLATGDFNRDGLLDVVGVTLQGDHFIMYNTTPGAGSHLAVSVGRSVTGGTPVGARVEIDTGETTQMRWVSGGDSFCSQSASTLHFGLGTAQAVDEVRIFWSTGETKVLRDLEPNQRLAVGTSTTLTSTEEVELPAALKLGVYPNPAQDRVWISGDGLRPDSQISLRDILGRTVLSMRAQEVSRGLDISRLPAGVYFLEQAGVVVTGPIIKR